MEEQSWTGGFATGNDAKAELTAEAAWKSREEKVGLVCLSENWAFSGSCTRLTSFTCPFFCPDWRAQASSRCWGRSPAAWGNAGDFCFRSLPCAHCATRRDDCKLCVARPYSAAAALLPSPVGSGDFLQERRRGGSGLVSKHRTREGNWMSK